MRFLSIAIESAVRLNIGQVAVAHELVAPTGNRNLLNHFPTTVRQTQEAIRKSRSDEDNARHRELECLLYNIRSAYHNYLADELSVPASSRKSFVIYDGPEVLGLDKIEIEKTE